MPLVLELELVSSFADAVHTETGYTGCEWALSDCKVLCDVVQLDSSLEASFINHLDKNLALPIPYTGLAVVPCSLLPGGDWSVQIGRSLTCVRKIYLTLTRAFAAASSARECNYFYSGLPGRVVGERFRDDVEFSIQIGSKKWPDRPVTGLAESFMYLRQAQDFDGNKPHGHSFNRTEYGTSRWVGCLDLERCSKGPDRAHWTGHSTKGGETLTVTFKNVGQNDTNRADRLFATLVYQASLNIRLDGCDVLD
jgi:hypothetical protein